MIRNEWGGGLFLCSFLGLHVYAYVHACTYFYLRTHRYVRIQILRKTVAVILLFHFTLYSGHYVV